MEENILEQILEGSMGPTDLPLEILRKITDNFSPDRIIGEGGFGTVYKGVLQNGNFVAVKRIKSSMTIDEKLFRREVDSLMEVDHQNIVKFIGFCSNTTHTTVKIPESQEYIYAEIRERLLCFEYISNGSLDSHITDELRGLEWDVRYQVIKGICTGLYYLHMKRHILHMDLKPANILLDNQMVPRITDFGLSRPTDRSQTTSEKQFSSPGYGAPENMFGRGSMSVKSDIYSLGTIIIELVTGHKAIPDDNNYILRRWRHRWNKSTMETPLACQQQVIKCIEIGKMCQSIDPYKRPFISDIMNKFGETESMSNNMSNVDEPTIEQINLASWEDDMLGVEPLELRFSHFDHNNKHMSSSCSIELSNNTDGFIAFNIQTTSPLPYCIDPNNNIVPPHSKLNVDITLPGVTNENDKGVSRYNTKKYTEQFIVRSIKVKNDLATMNIHQDMFDKGKHVDEVDLMVISQHHLQAPSHILLSKEPCKEALQVISSQAENSNGIPLIVHPLAMQFPFEPNKFIQCSLNLTNKADITVVFRLMMKNVEYTSLMLFWKRKTGYLNMLPLHGIVPPRSSYTLILVAQMTDELPRETHIDLILQNIITGEFIPSFKNDAECDNFFVKVKETRGALNEVLLQAIFAPIGEKINEIIPMVRVPRICSQFSLDVHPTEPWMLMGLDRGGVKFWNSETQTIMQALTVPTLGVVYSMKFVARKQWYLAGCSDGCIHVYDYGTEPHKNIRSLRYGYSNFLSLAIHPTKPYALSAINSEILLWDWDNDWRRTQRFKGHSRIVNHVRFNPRDHDNFASASDDGTVKVWNIDSPEAIYTLSGHSDKVKCLEFFTRDDQLYLISCSDDKTAKVWDMKEKTCVHTIKAFTSPATCVTSISDRPYLLTGSQDGLVHLWSSSDFRIEKVFAIERNNYRIDDAVVGLTCCDGGKRFAIGHRDQLTIMDINDNESSC